MASRRRTTKPRGGQTSATNGGGPVVDSVGAGNGASGGDNPDTKTPEELQAEFEHELMWCIRELELGLSTQKPDQRQAKDAMRILKVLRNPKAVKAQKRQVMRSTFGDYRQKMQAAEKQMAANSKDMKVSITPVKATESKSTFIKQSVRKSAKCKSWVDGITPHTGDGDSGVSEEGSRVESSMEGHDEGGSVGVHVESSVEGDNEGCSEEGAHVESLLEGADAGSLEEGAHEESSKEGADEEGCLLKGSSETDVHLDNADAAFCSLDPGADNSKKVMGESEELHPPDTAATTADQKMFQSLWTELAELKTQQEGKKSKKKKKKKSGGKGNQKTPAADEQSTHPADLKEPSKTSKTDKKKTKKSVLSHEERIKYDPPKSSAVFYDFTFTPSDNDFRFAFKAPRNQSTN